MGRDETLIDRPRHTTASTIFSDFQLFGGPANDGLDEHQAGKNEGSDSKKDKNHGDLSGRYL